MIGVIHGVGLSVHLLERVRLVVERPLDSLHRYLNTKRPEKSVGTLSRRRAAIHGDFKI